MRVGSACPALSRKAVVWLGPFDHLDLSAVSALGKGLGAMKVIHNAQFELSVVIRRDRRRDGA